MNVESIWDIEDSILIAMKESFGSDCNEFIEWKSASFEDFFRVCLRV
jgi:hypothetical protein